MQSSVFSPYRWLHFSIRAILEKDVWVMKKVVKLGVSAKGSYANMSMNCPKTSETACGINYRQAA